MKNLTKIFEDLNDRLTVYEYTRDEPAKVILMHPSMIYRLIEQVTYPGILVDMDAIKTYRGIKIRRTTDLGEDEIEVY